MFVELFWNTDEDPVKVAHCSDVMSLLTFYVCVTRCLFDKNYKKNPRETVLNKVLGFKEMPYNTI